MNKLKISIPKPLPHPELPANVQPDVSLVREHYPKIGERILLLWGSAELQKYLNDLIFDERGDRAGFPTPIAVAIMRLLKEHGKLVSEDHKNAWVNATY
jgi:hypothetical protein